MTCTSCEHVVWAWRSSGMGDMWPHFYCDRCSNAIYREADKARAWESQTPEVVERIGATLPECTCGGGFRPGANPKCPACGTEFTHKNDVVQRLTDPHVIVIHEACLFDENGASYRVKIRDVG